MSTNSITSCLLWPFKAIWSLLTLILNIIGRLFAVILGLLLMFVGIAFIFTIVGLPLGIPLAILGLLLMIRGLF